MPKKNALAIIFNCHCLPERSFFFRGRQFPVCARCTGVIAGYVLGIISAFLLIFDWYIALILMIPLITDGFIQHLTKYESNNIKRLITGILFGIATVHLLINIHLGTLELAKHFVGYLARNGYLWFD